MGNKCCTKSSSVDSDDVNLVNANDQTALLEAVTSGNKNSVQRLLDAGTDPNFCHRHTGDSPLILATKLGFTEIISSLLKAKADVNYLNSISDLSALMEACQSGKEDIVNILMETGKCDVELVNEKLENALMLACFSGHMGIVQLLIRLGCKLDCVNVNGESALKKAEGQGHKNIVQFLVEQGADVGTADNKEKTSEAYAGESCFMAIGQYLMEKISTSIFNVCIRFKVAGALIGGLTEVYFVSDCKDGELKDKTLRRKHLDLIAPNHNIIIRDSKKIKHNDIKIIDVIPCSSTVNIINSDLLNILSTNIPDDSSNNCERIISDSSDSLSECSEFKDCSYDNSEISAHNSHHKQTPLCNNIDNSTLYFTEYDADKNCVPNTNATSTIDTSSILKRDSVSCETSSSGFCKTPSMDFCETLSIDFCETPSIDLCEKSETPSSGLYETAEWCTTPDLSAIPEQSTIDMSTFREFSTLNTTTKSSSLCLASDSNGSLHQENEISSQTLTNKETNTNPSYNERKPCLKGNYCHSNTFPRRTKPLWIKDEPLIDDSSRIATLNSQSCASDDQRPYISPSTNTMDHTEASENSNKPKKCKKKKRPKIILYANVANVNTAQIVLVNGNDDQICQSSSTETDESSH